jgi:hypothetical protein
MEFTLNEIQEDCTTLLIPDFVNMDSLDYILEPMKTSIFESELSDWYTDPGLWPENRSAEEFSKWFTLEYHSMVFDILDLPIRSLDDEDDDDAGEDADLGPEDIALELEDDIAAHIPFKRQDSVLIKAGTTEPGKPHNQLDNWQGRIIDFMRSKDGNIMALVEWDSITLEQMRDEYIEEHSDQAWEWEALVIDSQNLVPAQPRDSYFRVERMQARLASRFFWPYITDGGARIANILKNVDPDNERSVLTVWEENLAKSLTFPFEACLERPNQTQDLQKGDFVTVQCLSTIDPLNGIQARVKYKSKTVDVPFSNLIVLNETSTNFQVIEDYKLWFDYTL